LLGYNRIDYVANLERAKNLTVLDLHSNKLAVLPESVAELRKLKTLKVSNNDLSDLNARLALLPELVRINIEGNPLKCISASVRAAGAEPLKKYLRMKLSDNEIQKNENALDVENNIPNSSSSYDAWDEFLREYVINGEQLDLKNKNLNNISPKVWLKYPGLLSVDLSSNPLICSLPEEFGNLVGLKQLRLTGCSLTTLPASLLKLKDLNSLEVNQNQLKGFYDEFKLQKEDI
jgi:internalin A